MSVLRRSLWNLWLLSLVGGFPCLVGCEQLTGPQEEEQAETELPAWLRGSDDPAAAPVPTAPAREAAELVLNLKRGDRFPLKKVVEQRLTQSSLNGETVPLSSRLELVLVISVDDIQNDRTRLGVRYNRVKYSQQSNTGTPTSIEYDSQNPPLQPPLAVLAYHGMVNDGFSFWIGQDNRIAEVVGFEQFLNRCLQHVPVEHRREVMLSIEATSGEKGISDFIDDTIALLPYGGPKALGDAWEQTRQINRPVPMRIATTYTLKELTPQTAEIDILGTLSPSTTLGSTGIEQQNIRVTTTGGRSVGQCTIFRDTGLPQQSRVEQTVDMVVQMAGGIEFTQQKQTVTTVEAFPNQPPEAGSIPGLNSGPVIPVRHEQRQ